eukprot:6141528-Lingulodinium_polyedra.AAC.1
MAHGQTTETRVSLQQTPPMECETNARPAWCSFNTSAALMQLRDSVDTLLTLRSPSNALLML